MLLPIDFVPLPLVLALLVLAGGAAKWVHRIGPPSMTAARLLDWTARLVRIGWLTFAAGFASGLVTGTLNLFERFQKSFILAWDPSILYSLTLLAAVGAAVTGGRALLFTARAIRADKGDLASMLYPSRRWVPIRAASLALAVLLVGTFFPAGPGVFTWSARGLVHEVAFGTGPWLPRERSYLAGGGPGGWGRTRVHVGPEPGEQQALRRRASRAVGIAHLYLWAIHGSDLWKDGENRTARIAFLLRVLGHGGKGQHDLLLRWLRDENTATELRLAAAKSLGELKVYEAAGDVARLAPLRLEYNREQLQVYYSENVTRVMWKLAHDDALPSLRGAAFNNPSAWTIREIVRACMEMDTPKAWELINELLRSSNQAVSAPATGRLVRCWRESPARSLRALANVWADSRDEKLCMRLKDLGLVDWKLPCHRSEHTTTLRSYLQTLLDNQDELARVAGNLKRTLDIERVCTSRATY